MDSNRKNSNNLVNKDMYLQSSHKEVSTALSMMADSMASMMQRAKLDIESVDQRARKDVELLDQRARADIHRADQRARKDVALLEQRAREDHEQLSKIGRAKRAT